MSLFPLPSPLVIISKFSTCVRNTDAVEEKHYFERPEYTQKTNLYFVGDQDKRLVVFYSNPRSPCIVA
jgi:hypothetical protein